MKIRLTIWIMILFTMTLIIYQNREFYLSEHTLSLDLYITEFRVPPLANVTQTLLFFLVGILLACASLYHERFQMRREIKKLTTAFHSCAQQVTAMKTGECSPRKNRIFNLIGKLKSKTVQATETSTASGESATLPAQVQRS